MSWTSTVSVVAGGSYRIVVDLECLVALFHLTHHERAVDHGLETADRCAFVEREHVDGFDRRGLVVDITVRDCDARAEAGYLGIDRYAANGTERLQWEPGSHGG